MVINILDTDLTDFTVSFRNLTDIFRAFRVIRVPKHQVYEE